MFGLLDCLSLVWLVVREESLKNKNKWEVGLGSDDNPSFYSEFLVVVEDLNQQCCKGPFQVNLEATKILLPLVPTGGEGRYRT